MALAIETALGHLVHSIGGDLVGIDSRRVLDEAGRKMMRACVGWNWVKRPSAVLTTTIAQSYVALPSDFGATVSVAYTSSVFNRIRETSLEDILMRRTAGIDSYLLYVAPVFAASTLGVPTPRFELFPTPTAVDSITLFYRARWVDMASTDAQQVPVPEWLEDLYIQFVRATTRGYQFNTMEIEIANVKMSTDWADALDADGAIQWRHGPIENGSLACASAEYGQNWFLTNPALPPAAG